MSCLSEEVSNGRFILNGRLAVVTRGGVWEGRHYAAWLASAFDFDFLVGDSYQSFGSDLASCDTKSSVAEDDRLCNG